MYGLINTNPLLSLLTSNGWPFLGTRKAFGSLVRFMESNLYHQINSDMCRPFCSKSGDAFFVFQYRVVCCYFLFQTAGG